MAEPQQCFLKWNNYLRQLTGALDNHRAHDAFVDVTLLCEGRKITAHKVVLSSCSSYFKDIFSESPHPHPLLIFNFIKYEDLNSIIKFMYQGEVNVKQEGLYTFLQLAKVLSVHGLNTEGTDNGSIPPNIDNDTIPSNIVTSMPEPVRVLRSTSTDTNRQQKIQTLLKVAQENQAHRNLPTSIDKTTTHPTPSCSQSSYKKRKLTDTHNDNVVSGADDRDEQAAVNADDIASRDCMITNLPEYLLGQSNDQPSAINTLQEMNQNLDYNAYNVANIKTEYEILVDSDTEEKYTPTDDGEMTIEKRRLTNPSTPQVQANLDLTASCSNAAATGTEGAPSADDIASRDCMITNLPEYILGQNNDQPSAIEGLQEMNQNLDYNVYNVANIKTEYDVLVVSDTEEKYTPRDDAVMTTETRRLTNPSTPRVELTASCSNAAATGIGGASSENLKQLRDISALQTHMNNKLDQLATRLDRQASEIVSLRTEVAFVKSKVFGVVAKQKEVLPAKPLNKIEELESFEKKLSDNNIFQNCVSDLLSSGEKTFDKFIRNCWRKILTDEVARQCSWRGTDSKQCVRGLHITLAIRTAFQQKFALEDSDFDRTTQKFFQYAQDRLSRSDKTAIKKL